MRCTSMVPLPFDHGELVSKSAVHQCGHSARQSSVSYGRNCMTLKHLQEVGTSWHPPCVYTVRAALTFTRAPSDTGSRPSGSGKDRAALM